MCVLLKNSKFFWEFFIQYSTHFCTISFKNIKTNLKIGTKIVIENFIGTKSW